MFVWLMARGRQCAVLGILAGGAFFVIGVPSWTTG